LDTTMSWPYAGSSPSPFIVPFASRDAVNIVVWPVLEKTLKRYRCPVVEERGKCVLIRGLRSGDWKHDDGRSRPRPSRTDHDSPFLSVAPATRPTIGLGSEPFTCVCMRVRATAGADDGVGKIPAVDVAGGEHDSVCQTVRMRNRMRAPVAPPVEHPLFVI
jgi:hypothetical protein